MKLRLTPTARDQFLAILSYIRDDKPSAAQRFRRRSEEVLRRLERFPHSGRVIPEFPDLPYREVVIAPYRFFYRLEKEVVWVVAVWHGMQLPDSPPEIGRALARAGGAEKKVKPIRRRRSGR